MPTLASPRVRAAVAAAALLLLAPATAAALAPLPPSSPRNVLACSASSGVVTTGSGTFLDVASCTIEAGAPGTLVAIGSGVAGDQGTYELEAQVAVDGVGTAPTRVDLAAGARPLSVARAIDVAAGSHAVSLQVRRSAGADGMTLDDLRIAVLFVPRLRTDIDVCAAEGPASFETTSADPVEVVTCTVPSETPHYVLGIFHATGAAANGGYGGVLQEGLAQSARAWDVAAEGVDVAVTRLGTLLAAAGGTQTFALTARRTSGGGAVRIEHPSLIVVTFAPTFAGCGTTGAGVLASGESSNWTCGVPSGGGQLLVWGSASLVPAAASSSVTGSLVDGAGSPLVLRARTVGLTTAVVDGVGELPYADAAVVPAAVGGIGGGLRLANDGPGAVASPSIETGAVVIPPPDLEAPEATIDVAPASGGQAREATIAFSASSDAVDLLCALDDEPFASCTSPLELAGLAAGAHVVRVTAVDAMGNVDATPASATWTIAPPFPVTVTAADATVAYGAALPSTVAARVAGLVGGDGIAALGGALRCAPVAPSSVPDPGAYPTRCAGGADSARYAIRYVDGTLTVERPPRAGAPLVSGRRIVVIRAATRSIPLVCGLDRPGLARCTVRLMRGRTTLATATATAPAPGARPVALAVQIDRRLRRLARRPGGVRLTLVASAAQAGYARPLTVSTPLLLLPSAVVAAPTDGIFASGSAALPARGTAYLRTLRSLVGGAARLTCTGHTDDRGPAAANEALGLARARAVCRFLARGTAIRTTARSLGERRPRASNATAAGRARNRYVEIAVRYAG